MKILALEFSSAQRSVAVLNSAAGESSCFEVIETGGRGAIGMIEQALRDSALEREQIECIAIGLGPGSYTGIRSAIAIAQGWQLALGVKLLGIGTDEVLAEQARAEGMIEKVNVAIDAQRNEFYLERFEITAAESKTAEPLHLTNAAAVQSRLQAGEVVVSPDAEKIPGSRAIFPRAATLALLAKNRSAAANPPFVSGEELIPIYLRQTTFVKAPPPRKLP